jgi:hypothetical protein
MTTFHSKRIGLAEVRFGGISNIDPDGVGIEVSTASREYVFDVFRERSGRVSICFGQPPADHSGWEIELTEFRSMLERCLSESGTWENSLREPGEFWDQRDRGLL